MGQSLVEMFEKISVSVENSQSLRNLVFQLAIEGKLVEQNDLDGSAADLLSRIETERDTAIRNGAMRKQKSIPSYELEIVASLPSSWVVTCFAALGEIAPRNILEDRCKVSFFPMPAIPTVFGETTNGEIRLWKEVKKGFNHVANGDVALGKITPCFQNRKSCVFEDLESGFGAGTTELHVLRPILELVEPKFLLLILKSPKFITIGKSKMTGTAGQQRVPRDYFAFTPIGLPPLHEQKRIVAKVDELMALIDNLEQKQNHRDEVRQKFQTAALDVLVKADGQEELAEAWGRLNHNWDSIAVTALDMVNVKHAVIDAAVRGRLTQSPRIGKDGRTTAELANTPQEIFFAPTGWNWMTLEQTDPEFQNGVSSRGDKDGVETVVIRLADIKNSRISLDDPRKIPIEESKVGKYALENGDVLIIRVNGSTDLVGRFIHNDEKTEAIYCDHFIRMRVSQDLLTSEYLCLVGSSRVIRKQIENLFITTAGQKTVNQKHIKSLALCVPPLEEQKRIVAKVDELMKLCDQLEKHLTKKEELGNRLAEAVVAAA